MDTEFCLLTDLYFRRFSWECAGHKVEGNHFMYRYRIRTLCPADKNNAGEEEIGHESIRYRT
jgi:hypothetical protein